MKVDMSSQAVTARLKQASQLHRLCLSLGKAKVVGAKTNTDKTEQPPKSQDLTSDGERQA